MSAFLNSTHAWLSSMVHMVEAESRTRSTDAGGCARELAELALRLRRCFADDELVLARLLDGVEEALWRIVRRDVPFARWYLAERLRHALSLIDEQERLIRRGRGAGLYTGDEFLDRMDGLQRDRLRLRTQLEEAEV